MQNFTPEQVKEFENQTKEIIEKIGEGKSTREIAAEIYVENLPDKTENQGLMMADAIIDSVAEFDKNLEAALENKDAFITSFMEKIDADKTCAERCNYWLKFAAVIGALSSGESDELDREEILRSVEALQITEDEATPEMEEELRQKAREALENNDLIVGMIRESAEQLQQISDADEAAEIIIGFENNEIDFRVLTSMLIYTKIMNGEITDVPENMTIEQITLIVCTNLKTIEVADKVSKGKIAKEVAAFILSILGIIFTAGFVFELSLQGLVFVTSFLAGGVFCLPLSLILVFLAFEFTMVYSDYLTKAVTKVVDLVCANAGKIAKALLVVASTIICPPVGCLLFIVAFIKNVNNKRDKAKETNTQTNQA